MVFEMKHITLMVVILFISLAVFCQAQDNFIGSFKNVNGTVSIVRQGQEIAAEEGTRLYEMDVVKTGEDSSAGIVLQDDTVISFGSNSELAMKEFKFEPKQNLYSMVTEMVKGTFVYLSGVMGKLSPESVQIETPDGNILIRGTKILVQVTGSKS